MITASLEQIKRMTTLPHYDKIMSVISLANLKALPLGKTIIEENTLFIIKSEYETKSALENKFEAHKKYLDIQLLLKGKESIYVADTDILAKSQMLKPYCTENDFMLLDGEPSSVVSLVEESNFAIFFPIDAHKPNCNYVDIKKVSEEKSEQDCSIVTKIVIKVAL